MMKYYATSALLLLACLLAALSQSHAMPMAEEPERVSQYKSPQNYYDFVIQEYKEPAIKKEVSGDSGAKAAVESMSSLAHPSADISPQDLELAKHISQNNPEFRLIGPDRKPIRMRDDMQTKIVVALENLKKDAGEFWDDFSDKMSKGWTDVSKKVGDGWTDVNKKVDGSWSDVSVNVDKGLTKVNEKLGQSWTDLKAMIEKIGNKQATPTAPEVKTFREMVNID